MLTECDEVLRTIARFLQVTAAEWLNSRDPKLL